MKKLFFIPIIALFFYILTVLYSLNQLHKGLYFNDKTLIKKYVAWDEFKSNLKNTLEKQLDKNLRENKNFNSIDRYSFFIKSISSKILDDFLNFYINPDKINLILEQLKINNQLPRPSTSTFFGSIILIQPTGHSSFKIIHKYKMKKISVFFERKDFNWKITKIIFPNVIFERLKNFPN